MAKSKAKVKKNKASPLAAARTMDAVELAEVLGVNEMTVRRYAREGMPHTAGQGKAHPARFGPEECQAWMKENTRTGKVGAPATPASAAMAAAKLRKELALAERYELLVKRDKGDLVSASEIQAQFDACVQKSKDVLDTIGDGVAPLLVGLTSPAQISQIINQRITDACNQLART